MTFRPLRPGRPACGGSEATARRRLVGPGDHGMDFASEDSMDFGAYNRITWAGPAPITYGTPLSATQLNATVKESGAKPAAPDQPPARIPQTAAG